MAPAFDDTINRELQRACAALQLDPKVDFRDVVDRHRTHVIAALVPMSGPAGLLGPSCIAATQLAVAEVNSRGGVGGRKLEVVFLDCDIGRAAELDPEVLKLVNERVINGIVSMSLSETRERLKSRIAGRIPHIFTPSYDGNEQSFNVFTVGTTPQEQFLPAVRRLTERFQFRRWALVGKNNVHPHPSGGMARSVLKAHGAKIVLERYVPPGARFDPVEVVEKVAASEPDVVFMSLVGQDAVDFNVTFSAMGLDHRIYRFSELAEENTLMASGRGSNNRLFVSGAYFAALDTDLHVAFAERYLAMHGPNAPMVNLHGQSMYEGVQFYAALARYRQRGFDGPIMYPTARGGVFHSNWKKEDPVYLAEADGIRFEVLEELGR